MIGIHSPYIQLFLDFLAELSLDVPLGRNILEGNETSRADIDEIDIILGIEVTTSNILLW